MSVLTGHPDAPDIESSTADYQKRFAGHIGGWFLDVQSAATEKILSRVNIETPLEVVDVGGGHGQNIGPILKLGHKFTIVGSIASSKQIIQSSIDNRSVNYMEGSLLDLPCADCSFDVVISYRILAHIQDWSHYIKELARASRTLVIVDFPTKRSVNFFSDNLFGVKNKIEKNTRHYRIFSERTIIEEFSKCGFVPLYKVGQFVLPMALHRAMKLKTVSIISEAFFKSMGVSHYFASPVIFGFVRRS